MQVIVRILVAAMCAGFSAGAQESPSCLILSRDPIYFGQCRFEEDAPAQDSRRVRKASVPLAIPALLYSHGEPTAEEQFMLELVNRARLNPTPEAARFGIDLNEGLEGTVISSEPKPPLAFNPNLIAAAQGHSQWMLDQDQFDHTGAGGSDPGDRMTAAGYRFSGFWTYGENIAANATNHTPQVPGLVSDIHEALLVDSRIPGRGHRLNLMMPDFREVGIGVRVGLFKFDGIDRDTVMVTQDFAKSDATASAFLLGVVYQDQDKNGFYSTGEGVAGVTITPDQGSYYAISSASGGYAIPLNLSNGELNITFSGGPFPCPITQSIAFSGKNVKLDCVFNPQAPCPPPTVRLADIQPSAGGGIRLVLVSSPGQTLILQRSSNCSAWTEMWPVHLTGSEAVVEDPQAAGLNQQFYRALIQ
jgi:hypothetical protein